MAEGGLELGAPSDNRGLPVEIIIFVNLRLSLVSN